MVAEQRSIVQALASVMAELPAIGKADKSAEGYAYRGIEAITKHLQPLLAKHGVVIVPSASVTNVTPSPGMKDGWTDVYLQVDWQIFGPQGDSINARTVGIGRDRSDKSSNKAQTQAYKYLLLHLLSIADKADDSDGETYDHDRVDRPADTRAGKADAVTDAQIKAIATATGKAGIKSKDDRLGFIAAACGRKVESSMELTKAEAGEVLDALHKLDRGEITVSVDSDGVWHLEAVEPYQEPVFGDAEANA